jgi:hypothetical protein|tara:strand:- start:736 stop:924 length:189 start_codon:yes stop_codon:yes gene_type:complete
MSDKVISPDLIQGAEKHMDWCFDERGDSLSDIMASVGHAGIAAQGYDACRTQLALILGEISQ